LQLYGKKSTKICMNRLMYLVLAVLSLLDDLVLLDSCCCCSIVAVNCTSAHTHNRLVALLSGSWHKNKHSPTHTHEEEEEGFAQTTRSALSQRGLLDPVKPACNQRWPDCRLTSTASAFNNYGSVCRQSWSQYLLLCKNHCILYQLPPLLLAVFWILSCRER